MKYKFSLKDKEIQMKEKPYKKNLSKIQEKFYFQKDNEKFFTIPKD